MDRSIKFKATIKGKCPLIKISSSDIIELTQKGSFYMNSLKFYRDLYANQKDEIVGDPFEGRLYVHEADFYVPDKGICEKIIDDGIPTKNENDYVYCMFSIRDSLFEFSDEQKNSLIGFSDTALIITDVYEYFNRVKKKAIEEGYTDLIGKFVKYYDENSDDVNNIVSLLQNGMRDIIFYKRKKYSYQQEYRFTIPYIADNDHIEFNIGDISDISIKVTTADLFNSIIRRIGS